MYEFCLKVLLAGNYLKFNDAIRSAYPDIKIMSNCDGFLILWITQLITVIFMFLHLPATCFLRLISLIAHPALVQRCVMGFIIFEASVSDYAVTGNGAGTGSLLHWTPHWSEKEQVESRCNCLQLIKAPWSSELLGSKTLQRVKWSNSS